MKFLKTTTFAALKIKWPCGNHGIYIAYFWKRKPDNPKNTLIILTESQTFTIFERG